MPNTRTTQKSSDLETVLEAPCIIGKEVYMYVYVQIAHAGISWRSAFELESVERYMEPDGTSGIPAFST